MTSDTHFLDQAFPPEGLSSLERDRIHQAFEQKVVEKEVYFLREGDIARTYWFMESGLARSFAIDVDGKEVTTDFFATGDIVIDWASLMLQHPTREYIQALEPCIVWEIDFETFQELFHSIEGFREAGRTRLVKSYFVTKNHRVSMIVDQAKGRYLRMMKTQPEIIQRAPLKHIASYLGITDTSLSRIRKELTNK